MANSHYPEKSEELREFAEKLRAENREKASKKISENLTKAAETLLHSMTDDNSDAEEIALKKLQKDAAIQVLKFGGFSETVNSNHSGTVKFEPVKFLHDDECSLKTE